MGNLILLLFKYGHHVLFLVLELICIYLIVNYNNGQREIFVNSTNIFTTSVNKRVDKFEMYSKLGKVNDSLQVQNAALIQQYINEGLNLKLSKLDSIVVNDAQYNVIPVGISNSTLNLKNNNITLNAGKNKGLKKDMGIIDSKGIVGIIKRTSEHYSYVLSLLNSQTNISCTIKRNSAHGGLVWPGNDHKIMELIDIPKHVDVIEGDTIITSGYSTIFPKGILVGTVESFRLIPGSNSYTILVKLFNNPSTIDVVYAIKNNFADEQMNLELESE